MNIPLEIFQYPLSVPGNKWRVISKKAFGKFSSLEFGEFEMVPVVSVS